MDPNTFKPFETETDFITPIPSGNLLEVMAKLETKAKAQAWWQPGMSVQWAANATYPNMPGSIGTLFFVEDPQHGLSKARILGFVPNP